MLLALATIVIGCGSSTTSDRPDAPAGLEPATAATLLGPWRATPLAIDANLLAAIDRACRTDMSIPAAQRLVVVDARGGGTVQPFYAGADGSTAYCENLQVMPDGSLHSGGSGGSGMSGGVPPPDLERFELRPGSSMSGGGRPAMSMASGQAGPGMAFVTIEVPGQPKILASFSNGWYVAWWPGPIPRGSKVVGYDSQGQPVASADLF